MISAAITKLYLGYCWIRAWYRIKRYKRDPRFANGEKIDFLVWRGKHLTKFLLLDELFLWVLGFMLWQYGNQDSVGSGLGALAIFLGVMVYRDQTIQSAVAEQRQLMTAILLNDPTVINAMEVRTINEIVGIRVQRCPKYNADVLGDISEYEYIVTPPPTVLGLLRKFVISESITNQAIKFKNTQSSRN